MKKSRQSDEEILIEGNPEAFPDLKTEPRHWGMAEQQNSRRQAFEQDEGAEQLEHPGEEGHPEAFPRQKFMPRGWNLSALLHRKRSAPGH